MKRFNLSKELFFGSVLIGVLSLGLASCGGGGGGGAGGGGAGGGGTTTQSSLSFSAYIYQGNDYFNEPIITVYIDGKAVQLLADTGDDGLVVNQSAVNIPSSDYTSYTFSDTYGNDSTISGTVASATVCLSQSITNTCVVMPIGVITSGTVFPGPFEAQGDFGLASGIVTQVISYNSSGYSLTGYSYPTYLAQEYGINSFTISFFPLSNSFYEYVSPTTPIGEISFGTNPPSTYLPYTYTYTFPNVVPSTTVVFPSYVSSSPSFTSTLTLFDTADTFNDLTRNVFQTEIPNFSSSSDESNCWFSSHVLNGGFNITYQIPYKSDSSTTAYYSTTFTTEPPAWFCSSNSVQWDVMIGTTVDAGSYPGVSSEDFGLSEMLGHTFVWVLNNQGFVQGISIDP